MFPSMTYSSHRSIKAPGSILRNAAILAILSLSDSAKAQTSSLNYTTTIVYETVKNAHTITSTLDSCDTGLPQCNQLVWPTFVSNFSTTTISQSSAISSTQDATTSSISAPRGGFVLEETLSGFYFQLDDDTGRAILAAPGRDRLVPLTLAENVENLLQNSRNPFEILFLRYNASAIQALQQESTSVLSLLREIRHTVDTADTLQSSDYVGEWIWNTTVGQVELHQNQRRWIIYKLAGTLNSTIARMRSRELVKRANFYDLYMLPADIPIPENSRLQKAQFIANNVDMKLHIFLPTVAPVSSLSSTSLRSSSGYNSGSDSNLATSQTVSSSTVPDAYDIITSLGLEAYCSLILSYNSHTTTTTSTSTSISTSYYALFTDPSSTSTSTTTAGDTSVTRFVTASAGTQKRHIPADKRSLENDLTNYPSSSILSACSRAASSPTGIITRIISSSAFSSVVEPTSSTTEFGVANGTATSSVPIVTETIAAIGAYKLVNNDVSNHAGTYYGHYITGIYPNAAGYEMSSADRPVLNWTPYYFATTKSYGITREYNNGGQTVITVLVWLQAGTSKANNRVDDYGLYEYPLDNLLDINISEHHAVYFKLNSTTLLFTPDNESNPVSDPVFWVCPGALTGDGTFPLYYADAATFMVCSDYGSLIATSDCVRTDLTALQAKGFAYSIFRDLHTYPAATSAPSNALVSFQSGGSGDSGFSNSGQIDWVTLAGSSVKFAVDVLARLSKAGIEAFTLAASYAVLGRFKLGNQAEIEVYNSVGKLKAFSSFNSALYFGFGVKHVVRSLADSAEGLSIVSLCSILADFYGIDHSGLILRELFKLLNPPVEFTPTRTQWTSLIKACVGALSHSNFKNHLTGISSLYYGLNKELKQLVRGNAVQIATALFGLNQVSSGKINEVLIVGGADCALIAAIASWLLDLDVEIRIAGTGQVVFKHTSATKRKGSGGYFVAIEFTQQSVIGPQSQLATRSSGYRRVVEVQQLFAPAGERVSMSATICTRVSWSNALREIFGGNSEEALSGSISECMGRLFGALMLYSLFHDKTFIPMDKSSTTVGSKFPNSWVYSNKASQGLGLLSTVEKWFPECADTQFSRVATATYTNYLKLAKEDDQGHHVSEEACKSILSLGQVHLDSMLKHAQGNCNPAPFIEMSWFLFHISRCLSIYEVDQSILPSRAGLIFLREHSQNFLREYESLGLGHNAGITKPAKASFKPSFLDLRRLTAQDLLISEEPTPFTLAQILFSGKVGYYTFYGRPGNPSNPQTRGIRENIDLPGSIHYQGECFNQIIDDPGPYPVADYNIVSEIEKVPKIPELNLCHLPTHSLNDPKPQSPDEDIDSDSGTSIELLVSDTPIRDTDFSGNINGPTSQNSTLWVHYRISKGSNQHKILSLGPTQFIRVLFSHIPFNLSFCYEVAGLSQADTNRIPPPGAQPAMLSPQNQGPSIQTLTPNIDSFPQALLWPVLSLTPSARHFKILMTQGNGRLSYSLTIYSARSQYCRFTINDLATTRIRPYTAYLSFPCCVNLLNLMNMSQ
ncbi:hypothetical protein TWF703_000228 [Orbilia oligospora]|uniref:Uncharacterized protein n=1 Tax=Orbilia oligospora TaxID=2813651 RepID=A0A7C8JZX1_ORBOL|nr:hypothetical protein TWF703_000228 [Orbilia oligospora]